MRRNDIPEYKAWKGMKSRCYAKCNQNTSYQKNNIDVCDEWKNDFEQFYADMGKKPGKEYSLDRIDNSKGYSKENCRWTTQDVQCANRGSFNRVYTYNGISMVLKDWARVLDINYSTLHKRITVQKLTFMEAMYSPLKISKKDLAKKYGIDYGILCSRTSRGWSLYKALTTPVKKKMI
jgi:hypothetical protein